MFRLPRTCLQGNLKLAKAKYFKAAKTIDRITSFDDESSFQSSKDIQVRRMVGVPRPAHGVRAAH